MSSVKIPVVFQVEPVQSSCLLRPPPLISHALETGGCGPSIAPIYIYSTVQTRARPGHRTLVINKQNLTGQPTYIYTQKYLACDQIVTLRLIDLYLFNTICTVSTLHSKCSKQKTKWRTECFTHVAGTTPTGPPAG